MLVDGSLNGVSILIVEDDPDTLDLYQRSLRAAGATVRTASTAEGALATLATWHPQIVLCDLHLPGIDGYDLLHDVLANPAWIDIRIISISGSHPAIERERSLHAGFAEHLTKPTKLKDIVGAIACLAAPRPQA